MRLLLLGLCTAVAAMGAVAAETPSGAAPPPSAAAPPAVHWLEDLASGQADARENFRALLLYFYSPDCPWCARLEREVFTEPGIAQCLPHLTLVRLESARVPETAARYAIRGVPALVLLSAEGRERGRLDGFAPVPAVRRLLDIGVNRTLQTSTQQAYLNAARDCAEKGFTPERLALLLEGLGDPEVRTEATRVILFAVTDLLRPELVGLLEHQRLAVRSGALEMLEELAGDTYGFDPWQPLSEEKNLAALKRWRAWAQIPPENTGKTIVFSTLTPPQADRLLLDLCQGNSELQARARRALLLAGKGALAALDAFRQRHPDLALGTRRELKQLECTLRLQDVSHLDAEALARRLVFGHLEARQEAVRELAGGGMAALPVLTDLLTDPEPLVRETAAETVVSAGGTRAVQVLERAIAQEKDTDVLVAMLRAAGRVRTPRSATMIGRALKDSREEIVTCALEQLARMHSRHTASSDVAACLQDPRWRVRAAALKTAAALRREDLANEVERLLGDADPFVRASAVTTIGETNGRAALGKLEAIFLSTPDLWVPILSACAAMDAKPSRRMLDAISAQPDADTILSIIEPLSKLDKALVFPLALRWCEHANPDVACAALRWVTPAAAASDGAQRVVLAALQSNQRARQLAVLENLGRREERYGRWNPGGTDTADQLLQTAAAVAGEAAEGEAAPSGTQGDNNKGALGDLLQAFDTAAPATPASTPAPAAGSGAAPAPVAPAAGTGVVPSVAAIQDEAMRLALASTTDRDVRIAALLAMLPTRAAQLLPVLRAVFPQMTAAERKLIPQALMKPLPKEPLGGTVSILQALLREADAETREAAARALMGRVTESPARDVLLAELARPGSLLRVSELFRACEYQSTDTPALRNGVRELALMLLKPQQPEPNQILALAVLDKFWRTGDNELLGRFFTTASPWSRRAAYYLLARHDAAGFVKYVDQVANDSSEWVRAVLPQFVGNLSERYQDNQWTHHFGDQEVVTADASGELREISTRRQWLDHGGMELLTRLTADPAMTVSVEAYLCLLQNKVKVDLPGFLAALARLPDRNAVAYRLRKILVASKTKLGPEYADLLPYATPERMGDDEELLALSERWARETGAKAGGNAAGAADGSDAVSLRWRDAQPEDELEPTSATQPPAPPLGPQTRPPAVEFRVIFFSKPGCSDCERVRGQLKNLGRALPTMRVEEFDITRTAAKLRNEALAARFGVPEARRLVAPALFTAAGALVRDEIGLDRLRVLLAAAAAADDGLWFRGTEPAAAAETAAQAIQERAHRIRWWVVAAAGFADGINPCAFATLIFFVSYLQVMRRRPREIAAIGIAFIAGLFLTYLLLGFGLLRVLESLQLVRWLGLAFNWALAGALAVLVILSGRDAVRAFRGQLADMTLQLPEFLKRQTRDVIRGGARQRWFALAAFVTGATVAVLELACTGQVYLPTLQYMLEQGGGDQGRAVTGIFLYNVAFIIPLVVVFALVTGGMTSARLAQLLQRHGGFAKLALAAVFLFFFLFQTWLLLRH